LLNAILLELLVEHDPPPPFALAGGTVIYAVDGEIRTTLGP